jgi:hypothetical protein
VEERGTWLDGRCGEAKIRAPGKVVIGHYLTRWGQLGDGARKPTQEMPLYVVGCKQTQEAEGANCWSQDAPSFAPPVTQLLPGTALDPGSLPPSGGWLVQFGSRVFGGQGEANTG